MTTSGTPKPRSASSLDVLYLVSLAGGARGYEADLESVETYIVVWNNGLALHTHRMQWNVSEGTMGAFYFMGERAKVYWDEERCWADLWDGRRVPLDITWVGDKWDIVLADGVRSRGRNWWVLNTAANLRGLCREDAV